MAHTTAVVTNPHASLIHQEHEGYDAIAKIRSHEAFPGTIAFLWLKEVFYSCLTWIASKNCDASHSPDQILRCFPFGRSIDSQLSGRVIL